MKVLAAMLCFDRFLTQAGNMLREISKADIGQLSAMIEQRKTEKYQAELHCSRLIRQRPFTRGALALCSLVAVAREHCQRWNLWPPFAVVFIPCIIGMTAFILVDVITGLRTLSTVLSCLLGVGSFPFAVGLIVFPDSSNVARAREHCRLSLNSSDESIRENRARIQVLSAQIEVQTSRLQELTREYEALQQARSVEFQCEQIFARNWRAMRSVEFEEYLCEVFKLLGYQVSMTKTTGDQGVDLIASRNGLQIAIQVKGYENSVGNYAVQAAYAGMAHYQCQACAVITNSRFTQSAVNLATSTRCLLIHEGNFREFVFGSYDLAEALTALHGTADAVTHSI